MLHGLNSGTVLRVASIDVVVLGALHENLGDLTSEVVRVKAAVLYGDRVSLVTHKVPILLARMAYKARATPPVVEDAGGIDQTLGEGIARTLERRWAEDPPVSDLARRNMEFILRVLRSDDPTVILRLPELIAELGRERQADLRRDSTSWLRVVAPVAVQNYIRDTPPEDPQAARAAVADLVALSESSLVDVETGEASKLDLVEFEALEMAFRETIATAIALLTDPGQHEHPLFTRSTRLVLRRLRTAGALRSADFTRANRVELAARLISSVPSFPDAPVDELLDLRRRLRPNLERFRAAVADFEDELNTDVLAEQFDRAVDDIRQRRVLPALEELSQSMQDAGAIQTVARSTPPLAGSALALGAAVATGAPELAGVAAVAAGAATAVAKEVVERHRQEGERKKNRLFLLFDLERRLQD